MPYNWNIAIYCSILLCALCWKYIHNITKKRQLNPFPPEPANKHTYHGQFKNHKNQGQERAHTFGIHLVKKRASIVIKRLDVK